MYLGDTAALCLQLVPLHALLGSSTLHLLVLCRHRSLMGAEKEAAMIEGLLLAALYMYKVRKAH